jgi:hypothetical protein
VRKLPRTPLRERYWIEQNGLTHSPSDWPSVFKGLRDDINWQIENESYIGSLFELGREHDGTELDYIDAFLDATAIEEFVPPSSTLETFCKNRNPPLTDILSPHHIWLDERSYNRGHPLARAQAGPLTSNGAYERLSGPVSMSRKIS